MTTAKEAAAEVAHTLKAYVSNGTLTPARALFAWLQSGHESVWAVGYGAANQRVYNYGSIGGVGPAGFFYHGDSSPGRPIEPRKFKKFHSAQEGLDYYIRFTDSPAMRRAMEVPSLVQGCCALYERGYYENTHPDTSDGNAALNIRDYANALRRQMRYYPAEQPLGDPATTFVDWRSQYTDGDARTAWHDLFLPGRMRRFPKPRALLRQQPKLTPNVTPASGPSPVVPGELSQLSGSSVTTRATPLAPTGEQLFRLVELPFEHLPIGSLYTTRSPEGVFLPWRTKA